MKSIAGYTLMAFGAYYILIDLAGIAGILNFIKSSKENLPKYAPQIAQLESKIAPQLEPFQSKPSPNPTSTLIPAEEKDEQWEIKLKSPWGKIHTKARAGGE